MTTEEETTELAEVVDFLKNPAKFSTLGARILKGVLLVGRLSSTYIVLYSFEALK